MMCRLMRLLKPVFLCVIPFISLYLYAEEPTIIDTIWTENNLQGAIGYRVQNNTYVGGILHSFNDIHDIGDGYDPWYHSDVVLRGYLSFPVQQIPSGYSIDSVSINVYQFTCFGNDDIWIFPIWYNNIYYPCNIYHVDYGLTFEPEDFNPVIYDTVGIVSPDSTRGWRVVNITDAYISDMQSNRVYCQLMLKFDILTDYDQMGDYIELGSSYAEEYALYVLVYYSSLNANEDEYLSMDRFVNVYPNPCKDYLNLEAKNNALISSIELYNIKGQKVEYNFDYKVFSGKSGIDLSNSALKTGVYILKAKVIVNNEIHPLTKKITIIE